MKALPPFTFLFLFLISSFAQTPQMIEKNLLKAFMKIDYWGEHRFDNQDEFEDSLTYANSKFCKILYHYSTKYPSTIYHRFNKLEKKFNIISSSDSLFRIYSWDSQTGGTMHFFDNLYQYKWGHKTYALIDTPRAQGGAGSLFRKIYSFNNNGKTYYLCVFMVIESTRYYGEGLEVFSIVNGKLDKTVKLIKTHSGLSHELSYEYDSSSVDDWKIKPQIHFNVVSKTITLPLVASNGKVTHRYIVYKFTGHYFERVKN